MHTNLGWVAAVAMLYQFGCTGTSRQPQPSADHRNVAGTRQPQSSADHSTAASPGRPNTTRFTQGSGGSLTTHLGYGIKVNPNSSLQREWITADDSLLPLRLTGTVGIKTIYKSGGAYSSGEYEYSASVPVETSDSITAFEVRFVVFDIWGNFVKTLSDTEIEDIPAGAKRTFTPAWRIWSENEVSEHYASIAFIARVRTKAGKVYEANFDPVVNEARKISARFAPEDLEPARRSARDSTGAKS